jgi:hypothetical protein
MSGMREIAVVLGAMLAMEMASPVARAQSPTSQQATPRSAAMPNNARFGNPNAYARKYEDYLYGVIAKITPTGIVLDKTKFGVPKTVEVTRKTKYVRNGKRGSENQLKRGDMVYVQVKKAGKSGALWAKRVVSGVWAAGGG